MGKKARKTRWRTLSIGENPSDTESQSGEGSKSYAPRGRWSQGGSVSGAHQKYNSSHSTPTRHNSQYNYHQKFGGDSSTKWGPSSRAPHPVVSTRSSSTASDTKITFNEDEYTKITTPRQDVLFKKGYLNKPKPYLQRPLTSAGNSTGDGTPDHQSADGADYPENDLEPLHWAPNLNDPGLYYLNYDSMYFVDQFGAPTLCYPPHGVLHPSTQFYTPSGAHQQRGEKRYSVDSLTESSSPNNESNNESNIDSNETNLDSEEVFEGAKVFPGEEPEEEQPENEEKKCRKKRRRRKSEEDETEENSEEVKTKYSVDAEEFIPRSFAPGPPAMNFMPFVPHEMFPGAYVLLGPAIPPPHFYPHHQMLSGGLQEDYAPEEEEEEDEEEDLSEEKEVVGPQAAPIDIAKIVSKLEQAALEQKLLEEKETIENQDKKELKIEDEVIKEEKKIVVESKAEEILEKIETKPEIKEILDKSITELKIQPKPENKYNKTDVLPQRTARYADRLKTSQGPSKKPTNGVHIPVNKPGPPKFISSKTRSLSSTSGVVCPRLDRTAAPKPISTPPCTQGSAPGAPDQWISVSGKKKRKNTKIIQETQEIPSLEMSFEPLSPSVEVFVPPVEAPPPEILPTIVKSQPEVTQRQNGAQEIEKNKKDKTNKTEKKRVVKKRIIITDGALQRPVEAPSSAPTISAQAEILESPKLASVALNIEVKENKVPVCEIKEKISAPLVVEVGPLRDSAPEVESPKVQENETKKSKKKKNKSKTSTEVLNSSLSSIEGEVSLGAQQEVQEDQDVSLELERMIQRGLYANLEQRLQSFNPGDSFLTAFQGSAPAVGPLFVPAKPKPTSILPFPSIIIPPTTISPETNPQIVETSPQETNSSVGPQIGLSITQAVKDWMVRTRENTPEVEIFRRPQELRDEVLNKVLDLEEEDIEELSEDEVQDHQEVVSYEEDVDRTAQEALETRSRFQSDDLLPCCDYEHASPEVECAEDALNFQSGALAPRPRRGHGGLPYRAICCTVM